MDKFLVNPDIGNGNGPSADEVLFNCNLAEKLWRERVDPVRARLLDWVLEAPTGDNGCGAIACFGGHVGFWPEYLALEGASVRETGMPVFLVEGHKFDFHAEFELFGNHWMFDSRGYTESGTDYEIVLARIARCRYLAQRGLLGDGDDQA